MRMLGLMALISMLALQVFSQSLPISAKEYDRVFEFAVTETNQRFPFIHTFKSQTFKNGSLVSERFDVAERQSASFERQSFSVTENGKTEKTYQLRVGSGKNVSCSSDDKSWTGPQVYECPRSIRLYGPEIPSLTVYSVEEKMVAGRKLKAYRKFEVFGSKPSDQRFAEEISLIGADGLFVSTTKSMGRLRNRVIETKLTNVWTLNANFEPVVVPKSATPPQPVKF